MTREEIHAAQRSLVAASLARDELRETHRAVYPSRVRETDPPVRLAVSYAADAGLPRESGEDFYGLS